MEGASATKRVVVIGGGITGLTAAYRLTQGAQARGTAVACGLTYVRAATVGTHPAFLTMLSALLAERLRGG